MIRRHRLMSTGGRLRALDRLGYLEAARLANLECNSAVLPL